MFGLVCVIASNLFAVFPARAVSNAIDLITANLEEYIMKSSSVERGAIANQVGDAILYFAGIILLFALIRGVFMYLMRQTLIVMSRLIEFDLKNEIFKHYQTLSVDFYRKNNTGDLMARISEDVGRVRMYIGPAVMYFTNLSATFCVVIPYMFSVNTVFAAYVLLPLPFLSGAIFYVNNIINKKSDAIQSKLSELTSFVQEAFSGIRVIKTFGAEDSSVRHFDKEANEYKKRSMELAKVDALFFPLMFFLTGLSTLITVGVGGVLVINGEITLGHIAEFVIYVNLLTWPVTALGYTSSMVQRAVASQNRINEFLNTKPAIISPNTNEFRFSKAIEFRNVVYKYPDKNTNAINGISLKVLKGQTLGILGTTGSGKTTLAQLLLRMIDVTEGEILIDGTDIKHINLHAYKSQIGYVPQDVFLFSDSISHNIAFGLINGQQNSKEKITEAAGNAGLKESQLGFAKGFDTIIGERGVTLSGGQKQRVSIARALIRDPDILLFDDCLSAVDSKTEAEVLANLRILMKNKTAFIISHRVSTVKNADHIIMLEDGVIKEQGTHDELFNAKNAYYSLFKKQVLKDKIPNA